MLTKQVAYYIAQKIKQSSNINGWILFYPHVINFEPLSHNYIFIDEENKKQHLSKDYIEVLEINIQDSKNYTLKEIQSQLLNNIRYVII